MTTTAVPTAPIIRTYATHSIRWARGSHWTGYQTAAEAQAGVDYATSDDGVVETKTFEVVVWPEAAHLYQPGNAGIADRYL